MGSDEEAEATKAYGTITNPDLFKEYHNTPDEDTPKKVLSGLKSLGEMLSALTTLAKTHPELFDKQEETK